MEQKSHKFGKNCSVSFLVFAMTVLFCCNFVFAQQDYLPVYAEVTDPEKDIQEVWWDKSKFFYDALGRKTQENQNTRRYLFEASKNKLPVMEIKETKPLVETMLRRDNPNGQCCLKSFDVEHVDNNTDDTFDKVGVRVKFNAEFHGEEYEANCNPSCCEFKQEVKGYIIKNDTLKTGTRCKIDGEYVDLNYTEYTQDCYGRDCKHFDGRESYNENTYEGRDFPGLKNIKEGDSLDIRMEFNSYIKDRCNAYEVKDSKYWGFHIEGTIPGLQDSLDTILLGEINQ